jgi:hypothetical protein
MESTPKGVEMRATLTSLVLLLAVGLFSSSASAQCCYIAPPPAPDMLGPGYYWTSPYGITYGPNYCVQPPFPPFQGMIFAPPKPPPGGCPQMGMPGGSLGFPSHLYARSPRDYFMIDVNPLANPYSYGGTSPLYPVRGAYVAPERGASTPPERPVAPPPAPIPPPPPEGAK